MLPALICTPDTILFGIAMRKEQRPVFTHVECLSFGAITTGAVAGLYGLVADAMAI
jgi:hypothetical protein